MGDDSSPTPSGCGTRAARWLAIFLAGVIAISLPLTLAARAAGSVLFTPRQLPASSLLT